MKESLKGFASILSKIAGGILGYELGREIGCPEMGIAVGPILVSCLYSMILNIIELFFVPYVSFCLLGKRAEHRNNCNIHGEIETSGKRFKADFLNQSVHGLCIASKKRLNVGQKLKVIRGKSHVPGRIVWHNALHGNYGVVLAA